MSTANTKTRFCPSPTGLLHLGNIRTALFNALLAHRDGGTFLLRIEDTDAERSEAKYTVALMEDLRWLGLEWSEGPTVGGDAGPYSQSQRQEIYDKYYHQLEKHGEAYPCFCTEEELALSRKVQRAAGKPPRYAGTCRQLSKKERQEKLDQGLPATLRFAIPANKTIIFEDMVRGEQQFNTNDLGDFIIRRTNGTSPFMFCNAIDDAMMGVTHVMRGEDHIANTPRQLMILQALKLPEPKYGHISLIVGSDNAPLSKRTGSRSIVELRAQGFVPMAVNNYLARLGHHYSDESYLTFDELAQQFSIESLGHAPARFDASQLLRWQKEAVSQMNSQQAWRWMGKAVQQLVPEDMIPAFVEAVHPNIAFPADALHWAQIFFTDELVYTDEQQAILTAAGGEFFEAAVNGLNQHGADFKMVSNAIKTSCKVSGKALYQPLRVALTGELHGPEMAALFELIGIDRIRTRLLQASTATA